MSRMKELYQKEIVPQLIAAMGYKNLMQVPRLEKVVVNMGVGREAVQNPKVIDSAVEELSRITGQKPIVRRARKSIANFKLREGVAVGASVTLRRKKMYEFVDRFISIALPRLRDFKGIPRNSFDGRGNYSIGLAEQIIFAEVDLDKTQIRGLNVTFVTSAKTDREGEALLEKFGFPFRVR